MSNLEYFETRSAAASPKATFKRKGTVGGMDVIRWRPDGYRIPDGSKERVTDGFRAVLIDVSYMRSYHGDVREMGSKALCVARGRVEEELIPTSGVDPLPGPCGGCPKAGPKGEFYAFHKPGALCELNRSLVLAMIDGDREAGPYLFSIRGKPIKRFDMLMEHGVGGVPMMARWLEFGNKVGGDGRTRMSLFFGDVLDRWEQTLYAELAEQCQGFLDGLVSWEGRR